jgi:hypothetical protein
MPKLVPIEGHPDLLADLQADHDQVLECLDKGAKLYHRVAVLLLRIETSGTYKAVAKTFDEYADRYTGMSARRVYRCSDGESPKYPI